jgi:hypothetical protein
MRVSCILIGLVVFAFACDTERNFAIPDENYFVKFYGEEGDQEGVDFIVNTDGSVVMVGNTFRPGVLQQIYVVKVDPNGQVLWQRRIGLPDKNDIARDVELHPDGRLVIVGETEMGADNKDVYLITISQDGSALDSIRIGLQTNGGIQTNEDVSSVTIINNGFIVAGASTLDTNGNLGTSTTRDAMHLRFDNSLTRIFATWTEITGEKSSLGNVADDIATKVIEVVPNSVYYIFGSTNSPLQQGDNDGVFDYDYWVFQVGNSGVPSSLSLTFGDPTSDEILSHVENSPNQFEPGYILGGITRRNTGVTQSYLVKVSKTNDLATTSALFNAAPTDLGNNVQSSKVRTYKLTDGTFLLLADDFNLANFGSSISVIKLSSLFSREWPTPLIFGGEGDDFSGSVAELPDGRILISGTMTIGGGNDKGQKKMVLMKLNPAGKLTE